MEYHGAAEKNVRPDCTDRRGGHEILMKKSTLQNNMSSLISFFKTQIYILILICA